MWDVIDEELIRKVAMYYKYKDPRDLAVYLAEEASSRRLQQCRSKDDITGQNRKVISSMPVLCRWYLLYMFVFIFKCWWSMWTQRMQSSSTLSIVEGVAITVPLRRRRGRTYRHSKVKPIHRHHLHPLDWACKAASDIICVLMTTSQCFPPPHVDHQLPSNSTCFRLKVSGNRRHHRA